MLRREVSCKKKVFLWDAYQAMLTPDEMSGLLKKGNNRTEQSLFDWKETSDLFIVFFKDVCSKSGFI